MVHPPKQKIQSDPDKQKKQGAKQYSDTGVARCLNKEISGGIQKERFVIYLWEMKNGV